MSERSEFSKDADIIADARSWLANRQSNNYADIRVRLIFDLIALAERALPDEPTQGALDVLHQTWKDWPPVTGYSQLWAAMYRALVAHLKQQHIAQPASDATDRGPADASASRSGWGGELSPQILRDDYLETLRRSFEQIRMPDIYGVVTELQRARQRDRVLVAAMEQIASGSHTGASVIARRALTEAYLTLRQSRLAHQDQTKQIVCS